MKKVITYIIAVASLGCQNNTGIKNSNDMPDTMTSATDTAATIKTKNGMNCFAYTKGHDTIQLSMLLKDNSVTGKLIYNLYEKDRNNGIINGSLLGDTLLANYTFLSEGTRSVRQVIFLLKGNILLQGYGSMKEQNGRFVFSNKKDISFDNNMILESVNCDSLFVK